MVESFVQVLVWVCLRYEIGVLLYAPCHLLDEWATEWTCLEVESSVYETEFESQGYDSEGMIWYALQSVMATKQRSQQG
jgi:hypothetical protein